jgi:hypothetical protein
LEISVVSDEAGRREDEEEEDELEYGGLAVLLIVEIRVERALLLGGFIDAC